jgi:hypothetical protein
MPGVSKCLTRADNLFYNPTLIDQATLSGIGRIGGGRHTLEAMSDLKTIVLDLS